MKCDGCGKDLGARSCRGVDGKRYHSWQCMYKHHRRETSETQAKDAAR